MNYKIVVPNLKPKAYVCGNQLLKVDSLPLKLLPKLRKKFPSIDFVEFDPSEDFPDEKTLVIIDTAINAKDVMLFDSPDSFATAKAFSLHDFDLAMNLKLAKKLGKLKKLCIIAVPSKMPEKTALSKVGRIIASLF